jgi:hypothetical protein
MEKKVLMNILTRPKMISSIREMVSKDIQLLTLNFKAQAGGRIKALKKRTKSRLVTSSI